nr:immunoglobulin heavy chain junction region [Macaca mulatta]
CTSLGWNRDHFNVW